LCKPGAELQLQGRNQIRRSRLWAPSSLATGSVPKLSALCSFSGSSKEVEQAALARGCFVCAAPALQVLASAWQRPQRSRGAPCTALHRPPGALHTTPQAPGPESALQLNRCAGLWQARRARRGRLQRPGALRPGAGVCAVLGQPALPQLCAADGPALHMQPALRRNVPV